MDIASILREARIMKHISIACLAAAAMAVFLGVRSGEAHHSFAAQYDRNKPVTLKGTVTKVEWMNPHIYFYVDVPEAGGAVSNWAVELGAPNGLYRRGWRRDTLKVGDAVEVEGWLAKDGSHTANGATVTGPNGQRLFAGSSNPEAVERD
jgi:hypothetical protein